MAVTDQKNIVLNGVHRAEYTKKQKTGLDTEQGIEGKSKKKDLLIMKYDDKFFAV